MRDVTVFVCTLHNETKPVSTIVCVYAYTAIIYDSIKTLWLRRWAERNEANKIISIISNDTSLFSLYSSNNDSDYGMLLVVIWRKKNFKTFGILPMIK